MRRPLCTSLLALALLALALAAAPAAAQVATKRTITLEGARRAIAAAQAEARKTNATGVIAVVDDGGHLVALERLDGTFAAGARVSIGKARTAVHFKRPTKVFEDLIRNGRTPMIALEDFTPLQGGVPIVVDGQIVGGIGVSGAASAQQDEELAVAGANALQQNGPARVSYFDRDAVSRAFATGAVLLDGAGGRNYMVHASRREKPGQAEVHLNDTDVIYVTGGAATLVTGGTVVKPAATAPDEIRGEAIEGGEVRELAQGDVITVPSGTPHWFRQVRGPFTYYVVKVR